MNKKIVLVLPMLLILVWCLYTFISHWETLNALSIVIAIISLAIGIDFIWMLLSQKFIDLADKFKIRPINTETITKLRKQRRILGIVLVVLMFVLYIFRYF